MTEPSTGATGPETPYDELGSFHENAAELGLPFTTPPVVRRVEVEVAPGRFVRGLRWGDAEPELVLLHGGGQNAHTWDSVALALGVPLLAVDLPGHGHSDAPTGAPFAPREHAADVEVFVRALAPDARAVVGMSLGGLTTIALAALAPALVRTMVLVDVLPSVDPARAAPIGEFINGPESFATFDEILERTIRFNPTRSESSLRRGVLHNSVQRPDGSWVWRHQQHWDPGERPHGRAEASPDLEGLWDDLARFRGPVVLIRGTTEGSIVRDHHVVELLERVPSAQVVAIEGAGHSVQGDRPVELAQALAAVVVDPT